MEEKPTWESLSLDDQLKYRIKILLLSVGVFQKDAEKKPTHYIFSKQCEFLEDPNSPGSQKQLFAIAKLVRQSKGVDADAVNSILNLIKRLYPKYSRLNGEEEKNKQLLPLAVDLITQSINAAALFSLKSTGNIQGQIRNRPLLEACLKKINLGVAFNGDIKASEFYALTKLYQDAPEFLCQIHRIFVNLGTQDEAFTKSLLEVVFNSHPMDSHLCFDLSSYFLSPSINSLLPEGAYHKAFIWFAANNQSSLKDFQKLNLIEISSEQLSVNEMNIKVHTKDDIYEVSKMLPIKKTGKSDSSSEYTYQTLLSDMKPVTGDDLSDKILISSNGPLGRPVLINLKGPIQSKGKREADSLMIVEPKTVEPIRSTGSNPFSTNEPQYPPKDNQMLIGYIEFGDKDDLRKQYVPYFPKFVFVEDVINTDFFDVIAKLINKERNEAIKIFRGRAGTEAGVNSRSLFSVLGFKGNAVLDFVIEKISDQRDESAIEFPLVDLLAGLNFKGNLLILQDIKFGDAIKSIWNDRNLMPVELNIQVQTKDFLNAVYGEYFGWLLVEFRKPEVNLPVLMGKFVYLILDQSVSSTVKRGEKNLKLQNQTTAGVNNDNFSFEQRPSSDGSILIYESKTGR